MHTEANNKEITITKRPSTIAKVLSGVLTLSGLITAFFAFQNYVAEDDFLFKVFGGSSAGSFFAAMIFFYVYYVGQNYVISIRKATSEIEITEGMAHADIPFSDLRDIQVYRRLLIRNSNSQAGSHSRRVPEIVVKLRRFYGAAILVKRSSVIPEELINNLKEVTGLPLTAIADEEGRRSKKFIEAAEKLGAKIETVQLVSDVKKLTEDQIRFNFQRNQNPAFQTSIDGKQLSWGNSLAKIVMFWVVTVSLAAFSYLLWEVFAIMAYTLAFVAFVFLLGAISVVKGKNIIELGDEKITNRVKTLGKAMEQSSISYKEIQGIASDLNDSRNRSISVVSDRAQKRFSSQPSAMEILMALRDLKGSMFSADLEHFPLIDKLQIEKLILTKVRRLQK